MMISFLIHFAFLVLPPCAAEDSTNCSWNAQVQGNGQGDSFVDILGTAYYLDNMSRS